MSRLTLAERIVIECGIYEKLKLNEIAKKIGKSPESISSDVHCDILDSFYILIFLRRQS